MVKQLKFDVSARESLKNGLDTLDGDELRLH